MSQCLNIDVACFLESLSLLLAILSSLHWSILGFLFCLFIQGTKFEMITKRYPPSKRAFSYITLVQKSSIFLCSTFVEIQVALLLFSSLVSNKNVLAVLAFHLLLKTNFKIDELRKLGTFMINLNLLKSQKLFSF